MMPMSGRNIPSVLALAKNMAARNPKAKLVLMTSGSDDHQNVIDAIAKGGIPVIMWTFDEKVKAYQNLLA